MKGKTIILSLMVFTLLIIAGGVFSFMWNRNKEDSILIQSGTLVVNGKDIVSENVTIRKEKYSNPVLPSFPNSFIVKIRESFSKEYYYYADLPLTEVLKSLGMSVDWVDGNTAEVKYNDEKYILSLAEVSLIKQGRGDSSFNYFDYEGGRMQYEVLVRELILDSETMKITLNQMGEKINIYIDHDKSIINITNRED